MKFAVIALLSFLFRSVISHEIQARPQAALAESPEVTLPAKTPALLLSKLPPKIIDPSHFIKAAAKKHNVQVALVSSIVKAESQFNANAVSPKGAIGLMQLMPETAQQFGADPTIPEQNIDAGTQYLKVLLNRYRHCRNPLPRAIAAYNAGPGMVDKFRGIPPFKETRVYVTRVLAYMRQFQRGGRV
jgi:soluble lytic murein transglycosylase-like protein